MIRNVDGWIKQYQQRNALWIHDGDPHRPHALLTSGKHSTGFFNSRIIIPDDQLMREAASDLVDLFLTKGGRLNQVDRVVGPQTGATKLAEFISNEIGIRRGRKCFWASPAKLVEGESKTMVFDDPNRCVLPEEAILLCEDVLTTGGSVERTSESVLDTGGKILPIVLTLVNRSDLTGINGKIIAALINRFMPIWTPDECESCKKGSKAVRPKDNWDILNAVY